MTASLARFLPDFELPAIRSLSGMPDDSLAGSPPSPAEPAVDVDAVRAEAFAEGEAAARAELEAHHAAEREAEAQRHAAEIAALRAEMETLAAQSIPQAIATRSAGIAEAIAADVAEILVPLLDETVRSLLLERLANEIHSVLALDNSGKITVSGPEGLVTTLCEILGGDAERISVNHVEQFDIEVEVDRTTLATRLSDWSNALKESLA
ncbi:hypothetical protein HPDFL43_00330 [Hoeflea phototrophica DFL-43]|jgi:hypothetical protein|uniref:Flagellar biosynthesis/type III secretory pathway protein n=1 Tax=Hoeflea phototrophica (strain DSM 17068 / NCIMB 14078 / DFL-43) TaxID=411684 RepID=A9CYN1_HOEPD|nr:hypothetical protein [Hoeflea phototrophica]EDQ34597.1 hypothetical protein HPDFL43_00330 [Hoeflea phototrophica DFL-43]